MDGWWDGGKGKGRDGDWDIYLLVTCEIISSPPCRRVADTSWCGSGWPSPASVVRSSGVLYRLSTLARYFDH